MIEAGYVRTMARYNAWQNKQLTEMLADMSDGELRKDRGAFFGSIMNTLNHILFADVLWMNRFGSGVEAPDAAVNHLEFTPTFAVWTAERFRLDGAIRTWAYGLKSVDLKGLLTWSSATMRKTFQTPMETCVVGFLNHQTHHRGQVHAMMTAAGLNAPVIDLVYMPEDA